MSETISPGVESAAHGITRRSFLKTTGAITGAAAIAGVGAPSLTALAQDYSAGQPSNQGEQIFRGVCRPNCFGYCHLNVHVRNGNVVKTSRGEYNEKCYTRICHRGLSHVQRIYDPARLQYPMRRVEGTARGEGQWERISWDEAFEEIADNIKKTQQQYGEGAFAFLSMSGNTGATVGNTYSRFRNILNASDISMSVDAANMHALMAMAGTYVSPMGGLMMWEGNELTDVKNAKAFVAWGANVTDAQVQSWHLIKEAKETGTKLVVIDPSFTQLAAKADKWISIRPGTDTLLKYAIMNIVLEKGAQDDAFLRDHTVAPFLVRSDTGKFLRRSDTGVAPVPTGKMNPLTGQEIIADPYMVLSGGELKPLDEAGSNVDLSGSYAYEGVPCRTAYDILVEEIHTHTPESVSKLTDVSVEDIYDLANICMDTPVFHYEGYGPQAYGNGAHTSMAGLTLCGLQGNLGKPGASYGLFWGMHTGVNSTWTAPTGPSTGAEINSVDFANVIARGELAGKKMPIKMLWIYSGNPLNTCPETNTWINDIFGSMDYIVVADSVMTDTARYADIVLPVCQWFEVEEIAYAGQTVSIHHSEQAIEPLYESKPDALIIKGVAEKLGFGDMFPDSQKEILQALYSGPLAETLGITYDDIVEKKQIRFLGGDAETAPHIAYEGGVFTTPSGRLEFYVENPTISSVTTKTPTAEEIERDHMAHWFPPFEAWPENELAKKYPLVCMSERPRYRVHSQWFSVPLLRELDPEPIVKINPADARERGIENNDYVECFNDRGHAVAKAMYSEGVRPGTLVYPKGWQRYQHKAGGWSELSSTEFDVFTVNGNFMDVLCEVRKWDGGAK